MIKDKEHVFIFISALTAIIVPGQAFADSVA